VVALGQVDVVAREALGKDPRLGHVVRHLHHAWSTPPCSMLCRCNARADACHAMPCHAYVP
jgi:hypothetical protein